ncbi:MAG: T9SS type A sorting domain-containing protein [Bacteroidota bacterium]
MNIKLTLFSSLWLIILVLSGNEVGAQGWERIYFEEPSGTMPYASSSAEYIFLQLNGSFIFGANVQGQASFLFTDAEGLITDLVDVPGTGGALMRASDQNFVYGYRSNSSAPPTEDVYLRKYNENGDVIWTHSPEGHLFGNEGVTDLVESSDANYVFAGGRANFSPQRLYQYVTKMDEAGNTIWKYVSPELPETNMYNNRLIETTDGGFLVVASSSWFTENNPIITNMVKLSSSGFPLWERSPDADIQVEELLLAPDGNIMMSGLNMDRDFSLLKVDNDGDTIWESVFPAATIGSGLFNRLINTADGGFALLFTINDDLLLLKTDADGNEEWRQSYGSPFRDYGQDLEQLPDGGYLLAGSANGMGEDQALYLVRTDDMGNALSEIIEGYVTYDRDENCTADPDSEQGLEDWIVGATGTTGGTFYAAVEADGYYQIPAPADDYTVALSLPNVYWNACVNDVALSHIDTTTLDFAVQSVEQCPLMEVQVQHFGLRLCEPTTMFVQCRNQGTEAAENVSVELNLADSLSLLSATVPFQQTGPNTYTFTIGELDFLEAMTFRLEVQLGCAVELLGQSLCVEAHIFPDSSCLLPDDNWTGASVELRAACNEGQVEFMIKNVGTAPMAGPLNYTVIEDHVIMQEEIPFGPLTTGQQLNVPLPANGSFYRLESEQEPNHPGLSMPSVFVEGCGTNEAGEISLGFVNQYSFDDADHFVDIHCSEVLGAYDPNAKSASPLGYETAHFIAPNTPIDYTIQFQNVGTAPARTVVVYDRLPQVLDPATIRPGLSSHDYDFELLTDGVVRFTFTNINLPDSVSNPTASQGFVQFHIEQDSDLPSGTTIENEAAIFFDSNPAIITNKTLHTIGSDFIRVSVDHTYLPDLSVRAFPNPFSESTTIEVEAASGLEDLSFHLLDIYGRELLVDHFTGNHYLLERNDLAAGTYLYQLRSNGGLVSVGKILVQ